MEKKKMQRMVGILVMLALVIVAMPFLIGKNEAPIPVQEAANATPPPFPDQQSVSSTQPINSAEIEPNKPEPDTSNTVAAAIINPAPDAAPASTPSTSSPDVSSTTTTIAPTPASSPVAEATTNLAPVAGAPAEANTATTSTSSAPDAAPKETSVVYERPQPQQLPSPSMEQAVVKTEETPHVLPSPQEIENVLKSSSAPEPKHIRLKEKQAVHKIKKMQEASNTRAVKIPALAWAVQMGNFKVKKNAVNLTNKLRAAGFKAFTREVKLASGEVLTRVYVGPEIKQASATQLSRSVRQQLNMQGLVIPYHPLDI